MRLLRIPIILAATLIFACNSNRDKLTVKSDKGSLTVDTKSIVAAAEQANDKNEALKKLTPLTVDQLKALVPEEFMGMKRTRFNAHSQMGFGMVSADYKTEGDNPKELQVQVMDCAGEAGYGYFSMSFLMWSFEEQTDDGYQKTIQFNGEKAIEKYSKSSDQYTLTYPSNDRFLVVLEGRHMSLDEVKQAANNLKPTAN